MMSKKATSLSVQGKVGLTPWARMPHSLIFCPGERLGGHSLGFPAAQTSSTPQ